MTEPSWHPAPAPGASPRMPLPPESEAARTAAEKVGREYGKFRAELDSFFFAIFETPGMGGITLWDRMTPDERRKTMAKVQVEFGQLPNLPTATNLTMVVAIREGFQSGSSSAYETQASLQEVEPRDAISNNSAPERR
jgi:hypothetical protein